MSTHGWPSPGEGRDELRILVIGLFQYSVDKSMLYNTVCVDLPLYCLI